MNLPNPFKRITSVVGNRYRSMRAEPVPEGQLDSGRTEEGLAQIEALVKQAGDSYSGSDRLIWDILDRYNGDCKLDLARTCNNLADRMGTLEDYVHRPGDMFFTLAKRSLRTHLRDHFQPALGRYKMALDEWVTGLPVFETHAYMDVDETDPAAVANVKSICGGHSNKNAFYETCTIAASVANYPRGRDIAEKLFLSSHSLFMSNPDNYVRFVHLVENAARQNVEAADMVLAHPETYIANATLQNELALRNHIDDAIKADAVASLAQPYTP